MSKDKVNRGFWVLSCIVSLVAIIGIVSIPINQSASEKFIIGIILGIGISCLVFAIILLIKKKNL